MEYTDLGATNVKMLYYNKVNVSERTDVNRSDKLKECMICRYWYFKDIGYKYEPEICNRCPDTSMLTYGLENIAILNVKRY